MPNRKQNDVTNLNQGVNYMDQGQQPVQPVAPVAPVQPTAPVPPAQPAQPVMQAAPVAQQPIVNTDALKAQAGNLANNAKSGVNTYIEKLKTDKGVLIGTIVGAVLIFVLLVIVGSKLLNPSYNVVNKYMNGMKKFNAEKIAKLYNEEMLEKRYDDVDEFIEYLEENFEELEDDDYKIDSFKIREAEKYSEDELEDLAETLDEYYGIDEDEVKAAKKYWVRSNLDEDGEKNIEYESVVVVKIGNKWYLYS